MQATCVRYALFESKISGPHWKGDRARGKERIWVTEGHALTVPILNEASNLILYSSPSPSPTQKSECSPHEPGGTCAGIPGDGRCLFRSVVHCACLREGMPRPSENRQKELADELRNKVVDEFIKRREDTEWFLEGDFNAYVKQMRQPHTWGGEPELLMSSHVLQMPITVYMWDKKSGLKVIAEYGQSYGKEDPIRVLYHGYGHYDALQTPLGDPKHRV